VPLLLRALRAPPPEVLGWALPEVRDERIAEAAVCWAASRKPASVDDSLASLRGQPRAASTTAVTQAELQRMHTYLARLLPPERFPVVARPEHVFLSNYADALGVTDATLLRALRRLVPAHGPPPLYVSIRAGIADLFRALQEAEQDVVPDAADT
jgi:hypothetical protein